MVFAVSRRLFFPFVYLLLCICVAELGFNSLRRHAARMHKRQPHNKHSPYSSAIDTDQHWTEFFLTKLNFVQLFILMVEAAKKTERASHKLSIFGSISGRHDNWTFVFGMHSAATRVLAAHSARVQQHPIANCNIFKGVWKDCLCTCFWVVYVTCLAARWGGGSNGNLAIVLTKCIRYIARAECICRNCGWDGVARAPNLRIHKP